MASSIEIDRTVEKVLSSKKYKSINRGTVRRIVEDTYNRYSKKKVGKVAKRRLHQIWGAYFSRPDFKKLFQKVEKEFNEGKNKEEILKNLLTLQTSTNERIHVLDKFYGKIFKITGKVKKISEPGCGLNALTYLWMKTDAKYIGYDVDQDLIDFINNVLKLFGLEEKANVKLSDIFSESPEPADVTFFLKVLTLFERQKKCSSLDILKAQKSKFIVISYPTKTLAGKDVGMEKYHKENFYEMIKEKSWDVKEITFENEIVFVIRK